MTAEGNLRETPLTDEQVKKLEGSVLEGDLPSMLILTADALKFHLANIDILEHRKWLVLRADNQGSRNILRNVAFLAAYTDDIKMTDFLLPMLFEVGDLGTAYRVSCILENSTIPSIVEKGGLYLLESANRGYFPAKSLVLRLKAKRWGLIGLVGWGLYLTYLLPQIIWMKLKNSDDPRVYFE